MAEKRKVKIGMGTFDLATGIAVLLVIAGHMRERYTPEQMPFLLPVYGLLYLFGAGLMPMFFIISGMSFKPKSWDKLLKKSFSDMILPYFWAILIFTVLYPLMHYPAVYPRVNILDRMVSRLGGLLLGLPAEKNVMGIEMTSVVTLWFFLALFIAQNLLNQILRVKKTAVQIMLVTACAVSGYVLRELGFTYFCIPQGMMSAGFCYIGYALKKWKLIERWMYNPAACLLLAGFYVVQYFFGGFNMASGEYNLLCYFSAACGGIVMLFLALWASRIEWEGLDSIRKIGTQSFWIIYAHGIELITFPWYELFVQNSSPYFALAIEIALKVIIAMMGCMIFRKISQVKCRKALALKVSGR